MEKKQDVEAYKENFLKNMLWMGGFSEAEFEQGCKRYHVRLQPRGIYIIQLSIENWREVVLHYKAATLLQLYTEIERSTETLFRIFPEHESFYSEPFSYHILISTTTEENSMKTEEILWSLVYEIAEYLEEKIQAEAILGVYRNRYATEELCRGFEESKILPEQHFFWPQKKVFWNGLLHPYQDADLKELIQALDDWNGESLADTIWNYLVRQWDTLMHREEFLEIIGKAVRKMEDFYGETFESKLEDYKDMYALLEGIRLYEKSMQDHKENGSCGFLVKQALQILQRDFRKDVSLEKVADTLGISTAYLSRIFLKETGKHFSEYLIDRRIDYAKKRIAGSNDKMYEIATQSGFKSAIHFSRMFRKRCGMTPVQYRRECGTKIVKKS